MDRGGRLMSNIRIDSPPTFDNSQKIIMDRFIINKLSASMLPEIRLSILELATLSGHPESRLTSFTITCISCAVSNGFLLFVA